MSGYGAVDTNEPMDAEAQPFNESDFLYLKEQKLTREEKFKKIILTTIPILVAFFIMGGIAYWLFKDFDHLYPGPSGKKYPSKYNKLISEAAQGAKGRCLWEGGGPDSFTYC